MYTVHNFPPSDLVSGEMGNPDYQIDSLLPERGLMVRVQLSRKQAERVIEAELSRWPARYEYAKGSDDGFLDELIEIVRDWVGTFPLPLE
jgi:hypothetical protein